MDKVHQPPNYLHPDVPRGMRRVTMPVMGADENRLREVGCPLEASLTAEGSTPGRPR